MCHIVRRSSANKFGDSIVNLVDNGTWSFWVGFSNSDIRIKYALHTGDEYYFFKKDGEIVSVNSCLGDFTTEGIARFSEIKNNANFK